MSRVQDAHYGNVWHLAPLPREAEPASPRS
jgi:hypothetical protein